MSYKIAIVIAHPDFSFENKNSAVSNFLKQIGGALTNEGNQVDYFPAANKNSHYTNVKGYKKRIKNAIKFIFPGLVFNRKFKLYFQRVNQLNNEISEGIKNYDLIIEFCVYGSKIGAISKQKYNIPYILIFDAPLEEQFKEMYKRVGVFKTIINNAERKSLENANQVICYSKSVENFLNTNYKNLPQVNSIPCISWKHSVERNTDPNNFNIGFIGSFLSWHNLPLLIDAFEIIYTKHSHVSLILIGFGEEWPKIKSRVDNSIAKSKILLTGFVTEEELEDFKAKMTIGVMPGSNWYGSPLKLFEYAESAIPIIAPNTPTVVEYFKDHQNALIIDKSNKLDSLINNLDKLIRNEDLRDKLANEGLKMMKNDLSKEKVMSKFVSIIKNILQ